MAAKRRNENAKRNGKAPPRSRVVAGSVANGRKKKPAAKLPVQNGAAKKGPAKSGRLSAKPTLSATPAKKNPKPAVVANVKPKKPIAKLVGLKERLRPSVARREMIVEGVVIPPDDVPLPRTSLTRKQLSEFKELLLKRRMEFVGDVENLTDEALNRRRDSSGDHTAMPIHMADLGSDNWEQEFTLGLIANERSRVREIDAALERIQNGTYGICLGTHEPIGLARLRARPWSQYGIAYARLRDEGRVP